MANNQHALEPHGGDLLHSNIATPTMDMRAPNQVQAAITAPNIPSSCEHPNENWLCLPYKEVMCNIELCTIGNNDLSVWCFSCDDYLDAQLIQQLCPIYETAYILKFGEALPLRSA
ncbi:hypothetical protein UlMin_036974 [Ulmus minor]